MVASDWSPIKWQQSIFINRNVPDPTEKPQRLEDLDLPYINMVVVRREEINWILTSPYPPGKGIFQSVHYFIAFNKNRGHANRVSPLQKPVAITSST